MSDLTGITISLEAPTGGRPEFETPLPIGVEESFRHSGWANRRLEIWAALDRTHQTDNRRARFACCGSSAAVEFSPSTDQYRVRANYCHDRMCQPCAAARGRRAGAAIAAMIAKTKARLRFMTLTMRHSRIPLADQLQRLRESFASLRHKPIWKQNVTAAVAVLEVKLSKSGGWHPHLHIIFAGRFIDQKELSKAWLASTGDSYIVDIRDVDPKDAAEEVTGYLVKYVSKPAGVDIFSDEDRLDEFILAMKGQRMFNFIGEWRGLEKQVEAEQEANDPGDWQHLGSLNQLHQSAAAGHRGAIAILAELVRRRTEVSNLILYGTTSPP